MNVPAARNTAATDSPVSGAAPPSKFQRKPSPVPPAAKVPVSPATRSMGPLVMLPFGGVMPTTTGCDVVRPPVQEVNGRNGPAGRVLPLKLIASVLGSKLHAASSWTVAVPVSTVAPSFGVGAMNRSGGGLGSARSENGNASTGRMSAASRAPSRRIALLSARGAVHAGRSDRSLRDGGILQLPVGCHRI